MAVASVSVATPVNAELAAYPPAIRTVMDASKANDKKLFATAVAPGTKMLVNDHEQSIVEFTQATMGQFVRSCTSGLEQVGKGYVVQFTCPDDHGLHPNFYFELNDEGTKVTRIVRTTSPLPVITP